MPQEQPTQSYAPRAVVDLIVRLDDLGAPDAPQPPVKPPHWRAGKAVDNKASLTPTLVNGAYVLLPPGQSSGGNPVQQATSQDGRTFKLSNIVPVKATLTRNGIRMADTLSLTIRFIDLPLDPRAMRAIGIQFYLGSLSDTDRVKELDGSQRFTLPHTYVDPYGKQRTNLRFEGWCDEYGEETSEDGDSVITLECTDNTRLLIDVDAPPKLTVPPDKPLDLAIATYLANFPQFVGLSVQYRPVGVTPPTMSKSLAKTAMRKNAGPPPSGGAGGGSGGAGSGGGGTKTTVWDYLADICGMLGLICFVEDTVIVIQRPRTLYASKFSGRPDDPFAGRILPSGRLLTNRTMIYGRNVSHYSFKRKFQKSAPQNVEVRSFSAKQGIVLVEQFPVTALDGTRQPKLKPGDNADETWKVFTLTGIEDRPTLRAIAQGIYEQLSRSELSCRFSTVNLGSFGGGPQDPDILDCQSGDAIDFEIARAVDGETTRGTAADLLANNASAFLTGLGFANDFAAAYGKTMSNAGMTTTYRIKSLAIDWDAESEGGSSGAINIDFEVVNFLEVRSSKDLPPGEEIEPPAAGTTAQPVKVIVEDGSTPPTYI